MSNYQIGYLQVETTGYDEKFHEISMIKLRTFTYNSESLAINSASKKDYVFINRNKKIFNTSYQKKHICHLMGLSAATFDKLQESEQDIHVSNAEICVNTFNISCDHDIYGSANLPIYDLKFNELEQILNQCNVLIFNYADFALPFIRRHLVLKPMALGCLINDYLYLKHDSMFRAYDTLVNLEYDKQVDIDNTFHKFLIGCHILENNFKEIMQSIKEDTSIISIESIPRYKNYFKDLNYTWQGTAFVKKVKQHNMPEEKGYLDELKALKVPFTYEITKLLPSKRY